MLYPLENPYLPFFPDLFSAEWSPTARCGLHSEREGRRRQWQLVGMGHVSSWHCGNGWCLFWAVVRTRVRFLGCGLVGRQCRGQGLFVLGEAHLPGDAHRSTAGPLRREDPRSPLYSEIFKVITKYPCSCSYMH